MNIAKNKVPDEVEYALGLEKTLSRLRGKRVVLSSADFDFALLLYRDKVPTHVAERAIAKCQEAWFAAHPIARRVGGFGITSLRYCRKAIYREFGEYKKSLAG